MRTLTQEIVAKNGATFFNDHIALRSLALQVSRDGEGEGGAGEGGRLYGRNGRTRMSSYAL